MGAALVELGSPAKITETAARRGFKGYGPGKRRKGRKADVREGTAQKLVHAWERYLATPHTEIDYDAAVSVLDGMMLSSEEFSRILHVFGPILNDYDLDYYTASKAGMLLSALVNTGSDSDYLIKAELLPEWIFNLGFRNRKNLVTEGTNRFDKIGQGMESGSITMTGDALNIGTRMKGGSITYTGDTSCVGCDMEGGSIRIKGDAKYSSNTNIGVGHGMSGGQIEIEGNASTWVGTSMKGGTIRIAGDFKSIRFAHLMNNPISVGEAMEHGIISIEGAVEGRIHCIGYFMNGGEIRIGGEFGEGYIHPYMPSGKIFHKGVLIVDK